MKSVAIAICTLASGALLSGCVSTDCGPEPSPAQWQLATYVAHDSAGSEKATPKIDPDLVKAQRPYWYQVQSIVANAVVYPSQGYAHYCEGVARIRVWIKPDGTVMKVDLIQTSGAGYLDQEALDVMQRIGRLPPVPAPSPGVDYYVFQIPIGFYLHQH